MPGWTIDPQPDYSYHCHDGTRLRAIIRRDSPKSWRVIHVNAFGKSGDTAGFFRSFDEAKTFVTRAHIFGVQGEPEIVERRKRLRTLCSLLNVSDESLVEIVTRVYGGTDAPAARDDLRNFLNEGLDD